jgi:hypothetical protein
MASNYGGMGGAGQSGGGGKSTAKIKVSQATIDKIKKMGMTKALAGTKSANPEMKEALTRMYGARRVAAASKVVVNTGSKNYGGLAGAGQAGGGSKKASNYGGLAGAVQAGGGGKKTASTMAKKKSTTTDPGAKFIFGVGRALAEPFKSKPKPKK